MQVKICPHLIVYEILVKVAEMAGLGRGAKEGFHRGGRVAVGPHRLGFRMEGRPGPCHWIFARHGIHLFPCQGYS